MIKKTIFYATLETIISKSTANDDFIANFELFDRAMSTAFTGLPIKYFASKSYKAREKLVKNLLDKSIVLSDYLKERDFLLLSRGMSKEDVARDNILWVWGASTNLIPSQFWMIYFIASNKDALSGVRKEVDHILSQRSAN